MPLKYLFNRANISFVFFSLMFIDIVVNLCNLGDMYNKSKIKFFARIILFIVTSSLVLSSSSSSILKYLSSFRFIIFNNLGE